MNKNRDQFETLDDSTVEFETNIIMNRINNLKEKKIYHKKIFMYPILTVILVVLFISTAFGGSSPNPNDNDFDYIMGNNKFTITRVSAHEYELFNNGNNTDIIVHTVVENPNIIKYNDEISYYKGFNKYLDVSEKTDIHLFEIDDNQYMNVEIDGRVNLYYEVVSKENGNSAIEFNYYKEFTSNGIKEFKKNIEQLDNLIKKYPPVIIEDRDRGIIHYNENPNSKDLSNEDYEKYLWYIKNLEFKTNILYYSTNDDSDYDKEYVSIEIIMDGDSIENIGEFSSSSMYGLLGNPIAEWNNPNAYESPIIVEGGAIYGSWATNNFHSELELVKYNLIVEYTLDDFQNQKYMNKVLVTPIFYFNNITSELDINDYDINIMVNGNQVKDFEYVVSANIVCLLPIIMNYDDIRYGLINMLPISIEIRDNNGVVVLSCVHN